MLERTHEKTPHHHLRYDEAPSNQEQHDPVPGAARSVLDAGRGKFPPDAAGRDPALIRRGGVQEPGGVPGGQPHRRGRLLRQPGDVAAARGPDDALDPLPHRKLRQRALHQHHAAARVFQDREKRHDPHRLQPGLPALLRGARPCRRSRPRGEHPGAPLLLAGGRRRPDHPRHPHGAAGAVPTELPRLQDDPPRHAGQGVPFAEPRDRAFRARGRHLRLPP